MLFGYDRCTWIHAILMPVYCHVIGINPPACGLHLHDAAPTDPLPCIMRCGIPPCKIIRSKSKLKTAIPGTSIAINNANLSILAICSQLAMHLYKPRVCRKQKCSQALMQSLSWCLVMLLYLGSQSMPVHAISCQAACNMWLICPALHMIIGQATSSALHPYLAF